MYPSSDSSAFSPLSSGLHPVFSILLSAGYHFLGETLRPELLHLPSPHLQIYLHCTTLNLFFLPISTDFVLSIKTFLSLGMKAVS